RGQREAADFRFDQAAATLARARELAPDATVVAAAEAAVERSRRRHARLQAPGAGAGDPRQVPVLLRRAAEAEARGDLLTPPGDSAFDLLRAAQAIAPRDAQVRQAVARLLPSARACFDRHLSANDLARARRCLDAREALGEDGASLGAARRRLAQRWLAIGDERLQGGQVAAAAAALESARGLDRTAPGLDAFERRLRVAGGRGPDRAPGVATRATRARFSAPPRRRTAAAGRGAPPRRRSAGARSPGRWPPAPATAPGPGTGARRRRRTPPRRRPAARRGRRTGACLRPPAWSRPPPGRGPRSG